MSNFRVDNCQLTVKEMRKHNTQALTSSSHLSLDVQSIRKRRPCVSRNEITGHPKVVIHLELYRHKQKMVTLDDKPIFTQMTTGGNTDTTNTKQEPWTYVSRQWCLNHQSCKKNQSTEVGSGRVKLGLDPVRVGHHSLDLLRVRLVAIEAAGATSVATHAATWWSTTHATTWK